MDVYETVESILDSNDGEVRGRTAIQKLVYLSKAVIPSLSIPEYRPHYYGPYCSDLSLALEKMVAYSFIDEIKVPGHFFEGYKYRLTDDGKALVKNIKLQQTEQYDAVRKVIDTCRRFCELKISPLSYASKIFYMLKEYPEGKRNMSYDDAINRAQTLGWDISQQDVEQGVGLLEALKLVRVDR